MLKGQSKTLKKCFVQNIGANKATVIRTFALSVGSGNHIEPRCGFDVLTGFFDKNSVAFENRLQAEDFVAGEVDLVKEQ